ncbi:MAG: guanylate kinase [Bacteroidota bacterium]|jgi:guanylate kinase
MKTPRLFAFASPSGGGKTSIIKPVLQNHPDFEFSVSATTRGRRPGETDGKDYFFLTKHEFKELIASGGFVEHEFFFDNHYGTLKREVDRALQAGHSVVFDVDVKGALSIRKMYPKESVLIFIAPPTLEVLEQRLRNRKTEDDEKIRTRLQRATMEMETGKQFDVTVVNNDLQTAIADVEAIITKHIFS